MYEQAKSTASRSVPHSVAVLLLAAVALAIALGLLAYRGVWRGLDSGHDLSFIYSASLAWRVGANPYDNDDQVRVFLEADGTKPGLLQGDTIASSLYPPGSYALVGPLTLVDWPTFRLGWLVLQLGCVAAMVAWLWRVGGLSPRSPGGLAVAALSCGLAVVHNGLSLGQVAIPVAAAVAWALTLSGAVARRAATDAGVQSDASAARKIMAGLLLGAAVALKPQLALPFVFWVVVRGHGLVATSSLAIAAGLNLLGVLRMEMRGIDWLSAWRENMALFSERLGDASQDGTYWFQFISAAPLVHMAIDDARVVTTVVLAAVGIGAVVTWLLVQRRTAGLGTTSSAAQAQQSAAGAAAGHEAHSAIWTGWALVAVGTLLISYHRNYDAVLLVVVIGWLVTHNCREVGLAWWAALAGVLVFLAPGGPLVAVLWRGSLEAAWPVRAFVVLHQIWALLLIAAALLWHLARGTRGVGGSDTMELSNAPPETADSPKA